MIFGAIINFLFFIAGTIVGILPIADPSIVSSIEGYGGGFRSYLVTANYFFPVDLSLFLLSIMVAIEITLLIVKLVRIILHWS